jgi:putative peptidoglycan binding protein
MNEQNKREIMKRIVLLTFIGSLALALTAWGAPRGKQANRTVKSKSASSAHVVSARSGGHAAKARTSSSMRSGGKTHSVSGASRAGRGRMEAARIRSSRTADRATGKKTFAQTRTTANREKALARANTQRTNRMEAAGTRSARNANRANARERFAGNESTVNRERGVAGANSVRSNRAEAARIDRARAMQANVGRAAARNLAVNQKRNLTFARNVALNRDRNVRIVNHWRNDRFRVGDYVAFYNYNRVWRDRSWWVSYYPNIAFVLGGWWYWNAGYWYPAWGYDPYGWYSYDGPIYTGYADRTPDRIIEDVQLALQQQGYYAGAIDGRLGPQTRGALAAFQSDNGLAITSAVDRPTLQTLGLT